MTRGLTNASDRGLGEARAARARAMWDRARRLAARAGRVLADPPPPSTSRRGVYSDPLAEHLIRLHVWELPGWWFENSAEACDLGRDYDPPRAPERPIDWPPGSPGKVAALCQRAAAGVELWHPADAGFEVCGHHEGHEEVFTAKSRRARRIF